MKKEQKISPLVMGALTLTLGMSLVNNANATLIAGSSDGATVTAVDVYLDAQGNVIDGFGEDNTVIDIGTGEDLIWVRDYFDDPFSEGTLSSISWDQLQFSVNNCFDEDYSAICLNKLDAGEAIDADWFNGTSGYGFGWGILFSNFPEITEDGSTIGNWSSIGDSGFVAFAYSSDSGEGETDIWDRSNVQYGWLDVTRGSITINNVDLQNNNPPTSVPEPASLLLLGAGLLGLACRKKIKRTNS